MGIIIDLIAIIIVLACAAVAYYKGFVKTFFGFVSAILALIFACILCKPITSFIKENTEFDDFIISSIVSINIENEEEENTKESVETENIGEQEENLLTLIDSLPESINDSLNLEEIKSETILNLAIKVSDTVIIIMSWIAIYVIVRIILSIVTFVFNGIMNIPFLKAINKLAGVAIGVIMGVFRVYLILAIVYFMSNIMNISGLVAQIQAATLVSHMYNSNLLIELIF